MIKRLISLVAMVVITGNMLYAQSVEQGKKFLYYERYKSARDNFEKVLAANPNAIDAVYWLGQTLLKQKDTAGARSLYQKALSSNGNAPLIMAGIGEIELLDGKTAEARQHFDAALGLTKNKDIEVINAIGRANVDAKAGDAQYAIEKLNQATTTKNFRNADTYVLLGDAYRKLIDGGNAVTSYTKALAIDPKRADAKTKIGRVYLTQGNKEYFLPAFEEAVQLDPAYTPAYFELFYYWYFRDVNKAATYLEKYVANADPGPEMEYLKTDFAYASGKFAEARQKGEGLIAQYGDKVAPRMYRLVAYTADTLGDMAAAKQAMITFLAKADTSDILPADYAELANINSKTPGSEAEAFTNLQTAVAKDTLEENKVKYITTAANLAKKLGDRNQQANWLGIAYQMKKAPTQTDLYNWGQAYYQAGNYAKSDSIFCQVYKSKYPNEIFGYLWCARSKGAQDTTMEKGTAVQAYQDLIRFADTARDKYKATLVQAHGYLAGYYANVAKNKDSAIAQLQGILDIDSTNADAQKYIDLLKKPAPKANTQKSSATKGGSSKGGSGNKSGSTGTKPKKTSGGK